MDRLILGLVLALCGLAAFGAGCVAGMLHMRKNYKAELDQARRLTRAALRHESAGGVTKKGEEVVAYESSAD